MNRKLLFGISLILAVYSCHLERIPSEDFAFEKAIEQDSSNWVNSVALANDGGYIIVGAKDWPNFGRHGFWCKTDKLGDKLERRDFGFGHPINNENNLYKVLSLEGTGYGVCGYKVENNKKLIYWALLDELGHVTGPAAAIGFEGESYSMAKTSEGDFLIAGYKKINATTVSACLVKARPDGSIVWNNSNLGDGALYGVFAHPDGYYAAIFFSLNSTPVLFKLNADSGTVLDSTHLDFFFALNPPSSFILTKDGGFLLSSAITTSVFVRSQIFKLKKDGTVEWSKEIDDVNVSAVKQINGGDYIICGTTKDPSFVQKSDVYLAKLSSDGSSILWSRKFGGNLSETASDVIQTPDGGFFIGGTDESISVGDSQPGNKGVYVIKTNANGLVL